VSRAAVNNAHIVKMRRFAGSSTSALLQKASAQLNVAKGATRVSTTSPVDDDGLADYLRTLNKKPAKLDMQWDKFGDLSNMSADETNSDKKMQKTAELTITTSSKFIKKKTQPPQSDQKPAQTPNKAHPAGDTTLRSTLGNIHDRSSALGKAQSIADKYKASRGAAGKRTVLSSESDTEFSLSPDEEVLADIKLAEQKTTDGHLATDTVSSVKQSSTQSKSTTKSTRDMKPSHLQSVNKPSTDRKKSAVAASVTHSTHPQPPLFHSAAINAASDDDDSSSSVSVGKEGSMFIKKHIIQSTGEVHDVQESKTAPAEKPLRKSTATTKNHTVPVSVLADKPGQKVVPALDSNDESFAEYMGQLSSDNQHPHTASRTVEKRLTSSSRSLIVVTDDDDGEVESKQTEDSVSEAASDNFHLNVCGVDALDYDDNNDVIKPIAAATDDDDLPLAHFGVHTVDELLDSGGQGVENELRLPVQYESDYESVHSYSPTAAAAAPALRSILSVTPRSLTPKSTRSRVRLMDDVREVGSSSPSPVPTRSRSASLVSIARSQSMTSVHEEILTGRSSASAVSDDTDSVSEVTSTTTTSEVTARPTSHTETDHQPHRYRSSRRSSEPSLGQRSQGQRGSQRMSNTGMMLYSEDFTSARTSVDYSELTSSVSDVTEHQKRRKKRSSTAHRPTCQSKAVQTGLDIGLQYWWPHGSAEAVASPQYGLAFADPASVAATVVSADALEAMTSYSPSMLALNDFLHQQVELSRQFIAGQRRLHNELIRSLHISAEPYHYTSLSDTKDYIRKHRRPVITFDDALRDVKQEMGLV